MSTAWGLETITTLVFANFRDFLGVAFQDLMAGGNRDLVPIYLPFFALVIRRLDGPVAISGESYVAKE